MQISTAGTFNLMSINPTTGAASVVKKFDWKLNAKIDLALLLEKNFQLDQIPAENNNFLQFQLSHVCDSTCRAYCDANIVNASIGRKSYQAGSIIDILWAPETKGNIVVDLSLFDFLTNDGLDGLLRKVAGLNIDNVSNLASSLLSGHFAFALDTNSLIINDSIKDSNDYTAPATVAADNALGDLASGLGGLLNLENGVTLNIKELSAIIDSAIGGGIDLGTGTKVSIGDILGYALGTVKGTSVDAINIAGTSGPGSYVAFNFADKNLNDYNAYADFAKNINGVGNKWDADGIGKPYSGQSMLTSSVVDGMPIMYVKDFDKEDGYINIYKKDGDNYVLVAGKDKNLTTYEFKYIYSMGKDLYVKYDYVGIDNNVYSNNYIGIGAISGLDLTSGDVQNIKLATNFAMGKGFGYILDRTLIPMLQAFGTELSIDLETMIPLKSQNTTGKIALDVTTEISDLVITPKYGEVKDGKVTVRATDDIKGLGATATYKINGKSYTRDISGNINTLPKDVNGKYVAGEYTVKYTVGGLFKDKEIKVVVEGATVTYKPGNDTQNASVGNSIIDTLDFGVVEYAYKDGVTVNVSVKDLINSGLASYSVPNGYSQDGKFSYGGNVDVKVNVNNSTYTINVNIANEPTLTFILVDDNGKETLLNVRRVAYNAMFNYQWGEAVPGQGFAWSQTWYKDKECTQALASDALITENMVLYTKYDKTVDVKFNVQFNDKTVVYTYTMRKGSSLSLSEVSNIEIGLANLINFETKEWVKGWSATQGGEIVNIHKLVIDENKTYYAVLGSTEMEVTIKYSESDSESLQYSMKNGEIGFDISNGTYYIFDKALYNIVMNKAQTKLPQNHELKGLKLDGYDYDGSNSIKVNEFTINVIYAKIVPKVTMDTSAVNKDAPNVNQIKFTMEYKGETKNGIVKYENGIAKVVIDGTEYSAELKNFGAQLPGSAVANDGAMTYGSYLGMTGFDCTLSFAYNGNDVAANIMIM